MARWLVKLDGEVTDLEEFPYWFPDGDVLGFEEDGSFYLSGPSFDDLTDAGRVHELALQVIDQMSAVISLLWSGHERPKIGAVIQETGDGKRNQFIFASGIAAARSKMRASVTVEGQVPEERRETQAQELLAGSHADAHLEMALSLWGDPLKSWPRLYRILEEVELYLGERAHTSGLCGRGERERFARSANTAEIAGRDARHAMGRFVAPPDPMTLKDAVEFVGRILRQSLERAARSRGHAV